MKKLITISSIIILSAIVLIGCSSTPKPNVKAPKTGPFAGAPIWVISPNVPGYIAVVGSAKIGPAGIDFATDEAMVVARARLANELESKTKNGIERSIITTGLGDYQTVDKVNKIATYQYNVETLTGVDMLTRWVSPDNILYVHAVIDHEIAKMAAMNNIRTSFKNDQALWQLFQAKKFKEELQAQFEKEFGDVSHQ